MNSKSKSVVIINRNRKVYGAYQSVNRREPSASNIKYCSDSLGSSQFRLSFFLLNVREEQKAFFLSLYNEHFKKKFKSDFLFFFMNKNYLQKELDRITSTRSPDSERTKSGYIPIPSTGKKIEIERNNSRGPESKK